jgi:hypothetical protein
VNYYENVVFDYLRADRSVFINTEFCIQLNESDNPDTSGPHWYCDAVACDWARHEIFLCEISYARQLSSLKQRLNGWNENWTGLLSALCRDGSLPSDWLVRPWLFVPEFLVDQLINALDKMKNSEEGLKFYPRITTLEMVQPWLYRSWDRRKEARKPESIPAGMRE